MSTAPGMPTYMLVSGCCVVWWAKPSDADPALLNLLNTTEYARMMQLHQQVDRNRYLVARSIEYMALSGYLGIRPGDVIISRVCPTCGKPHGRPRLASELESTIAFSVTHAGDVIGVAFALGQQLGLDVERVTDDFEAASLARIALTSAEAYVLAQSREDERARDFLIYWTRKEAIAKATGLGLALAPQSFAVSGPHEPPVITMTERGDLTDGITLYDLRPDAAHVASLAVEGACQRVVAVDGTAMLRAWLQRGPV